MACEDVKPNDCKVADCLTQIADFILNLPESGCARWMEDCNTSSHIYRYESVRIGNAPVPDGYKLAVDGGIMTSDVKVQLCISGSWCDYVFEDNYPLPSLNEVEAFINTNGHLPHTPSSKEIIEAGGVELKSVMINQQEKIEELFLYLIQAQEEIQQLKNEAEGIEMENQVLRNLTVNYKQ